MFVILFFFSAVSSVMSQGSPGPKIRDENMLHSFDLQDSSPWVICSLAFVIPFFLPEAHVFG